MKSILSNSYIAHGIGLCVLTGSLIATIPFPVHSMPATITNSILLGIICYLGCSVILPQLTKHMLVERKYYILPVLFSIYALAIGVIVMMRFDYSRSVLIHSFIITLVWLYLIAFLRKGHQKLRLSAIPNFDYTGLGLNRNIEIKPLASLNNITAIETGLVVDLHKQLKPEEAKFVADCSINNIPVFHSDSIKEMVEGKVQTTHLTENAIGSLQPNPIYSNIKRIWESLLIIISFPLTIPLMIITAILIKLENPGPAMFIQERVGQGGKHLKYINSEV